jgi:hypothetical protein
VIVQYDVQKKLKSGERQGATHHGGDGDVGASDDSLDSQEATRQQWCTWIFQERDFGPRNWHHGRSRDASCVQKIFLVLVWQGKV